MADVESTPLPLSAPPIETPGDAAPKYRLWRCEKCGKDLGMWEKPDETGQHLVVVDGKHVRCGPVVTVPSVPSDPVDEGEATETHNEGSSEQIACPWCGKVLIDLWDHGWGHREEIETECGYCDKPILLSRVVSVDYTARRVVAP